MITHIINIPTYNKTLHIYIGAEQDYINTINDLFNEEIYDSVINDDTKFEYNIISKDEDIYVWFSDKNATIYSIVYELGAIIDEFIDEIEDCETACYLQEFIFKEIIEWISTQPTVMDHFRLPY